jgi:catechol 2,3-dioxygenase-like lactoylglutathione lyase family enzyme
MMSEIRIDHIYRETATWDASVEWWSSLGFRVVDNWGDGTHHGARLTLGKAVVVLAEIADTDPPTNSVVFNTDELAALSDRTGRNIVVSHWGTSLISIEDPDGNTYTFETEIEVP